MKVNLIYIIVFYLIVTSFLTTQSVYNEPNRNAKNFENIKTDELSFKTKSSDDFEDLLEKAEALGFIRIIVGLQVDFSPEGELSLSGKTRQRAEIKRLQNKLITFLNDSKVSGIKRFDFIPFVVMEVDGIALKKIKKSPLVTSINEDELSELSLAQSVPIVGATGGTANGFSGAGQTIAIIDTGVSKGHDFFMDSNEDTRIVSEACYSTTRGEREEPKSSTSTCPDAVPEWTEPGAATNCGYQEIPECSHGTHVAGIAAGNDLIGNHFGVAKDSTIIAIKVFSRFDNPSDCPNGAPCVSAYTSDQVKALERVYALRDKYNIASANMSISGTEGFEEPCDDAFPALTAAINTLRSVEIPTIISSGNGDTNNIGYKNALGFPACISSAISVGSTGDGSSEPIIGDISTSVLNEVSTFSNGADFLNLYAPGEVIESAVSDPKIHIAPDSGTSMAAPHVAGAWAILKEQKNSATISEILTALATTGRVITDTREGANDRKTPRIRIDSASQQLAGTNCVREPITKSGFINGMLEPKDCSSEPNVNRDLFALNGTAGDSLTISLNSTEFDTYLYLLDPNGQIIAFDDNSGGGTNARIPVTGTLTLSKTGSYTILATNSDSSLIPRLFQNGNYQINILTPTVAGVSVSGQVLTANGLGVSNARISLTDSDGEIRTIVTNSFGFYRFEDVSAGSIYIIRIGHKRYLFTPQVININEDLSELNFVMDSNQ